MEAMKRNTFPRIKKMLHSFLRNDIVGRRVAKILQTPWNTQEGVSWCNTFVALDNGAAFQLDGLDDNMNQSPIPCVSIDGMTLVPADLHLDDKDYIGQEIREVATSKFLPFFSVAVILANDLVLCMESPTPFVIGPYLMSRDNPGGLVAYWGHHAISHAKHPDI